MPIAGAETTSEACCKPALSWTAAWCVQVQLLKAKQIARCCSHRLQLVLVLLRAQVDAGGVPPACGSAAVSSCML